MNRILIVDDLPTNRELLREALMCREYKITEAVDHHIAKHCDVLEVGHPKFRANKLNELRRKSSKPVAGLADCSRRPRLGC
jgi:CheY-like chemotaxis protein